VQCSITSNEGISTSLGYALVSVALPESLPTALYPVGLTAIEEPAAGRDGPVELQSRNLWLLPAGLDGVRVLSGGSQLARIGPVDTDGNGADDRLVGQVRIPSFAASIAVIPGFVGPSGDTLDLGLLAAGRAGLMLLDLRTLVDPPFGTWSDFFDQDMNGIDDRILRTLPTPGFATDVTWFRAPSGRIVALVADADTGSVPVAVDYNPALVTAGTGAGVVAIDVTAAGARRRPSRSRRWAWSRSPRPGGRPTRAMPAGSRTRATACTSRSRPRRGAFRSCARRWGERPR
jgi:hypothetical protein